MNIQLQMPWQRQSAIHLYIVMEKVTSKIRFLRIHAHVTYKIIEILQKMFSQKIK